MGDLTEGAGALWLLALLGFIALGAVMAFGWAWTRRRRLRTPAELRGEGGQAEERRHLQPSAD